ncbi:hypothetical protein GCM10022252_23420 [Streptosporangium oxazolinicum]|uniref:Uncharacterized protein n=1 Tax=Streptosporangium oxazolinicum TaxID=909287 RepID=A0ABP8AQU4_9ACTN
MKSCEQSPTVSGAEADTAHAKRSAAEKHEEPGISEAREEKYNDALADVQRLLRDYGVRSCAIRTFGLRLSDKRGRPIQLGETKRYVPELVVHGAAGRVATVTMGPRSGCYLVSLREDPDPQAVREPRQVADLILAARSGGRS